MQKLKKFMCLILTVIMLLSMNIPAFAIDTEKAVSTKTKTSMTENNLKIEVEANKDSFSVLDIAKFNVTVTNTGTEDLQNVSAEVVFSDLSPVSRKSELKKEIDTLKAGESISFSYSATLNKNAHSLNIFQKLFLCIKRFFNGNISASDNGFDDGRREYITKTDTYSFGKFNAENTLKVWYGEREYISSKDANEMETVDYTLSQLMASETYQNSEQEERINIVKNKLLNLEKDGLIEKDSINYNEDTKVFHYKYACGITGIVLIEKQKQYSDPWLNPIGLTDNNLLEKIKRQTDTIKDNNIVERKKVNTVLMYGFDEEKSELVDGSYQPIERCLDDWTELCDKKGMNANIYDCPTVFDFKTALLGNDYICIFEHGIYDSFVENTYVFQVMGEEVTEITDLAYDTDLYFKRIGKFTNDEGTHYYITPDFFEFYYKNKLNDSIVYLTSCQGFGNDVVLDYGIAETLTQICGVETVLGFHNSVAQCYAYKIYDIFIDLLLNGITVGEAYDSVIDELGATDSTYMLEYLYELEDMTLRKEWFEVANDKREKGTSASFLLYGNRNKRFDVSISTITGTVKDSDNNSAITGVKVEFVDNENVDVNDSSTLNPVATTTTDENGQFTVQLPYGDYSMSFNHDSYEYYGTSLKVDTENIVYLEPFLLVPKDDDENGDNTESTPVEFAGGDGTQENPYQVATPEQLNAVRNYLDCHFIQVADIDMSDWGNWKPIGQGITKYSTTGNAINVEEKLFTGSYNGCNYSIENLYINENNMLLAYYDCFGFFSKIENATLTNINVKNLNMNINKFTTDYYDIWENEGKTLSVCAGGICGISDKTSKIENCKVSGSIYVYFCSDACVGGIVGLGSANGCSNYSNIRVSADALSRYDYPSSTVYCGGIVGTTPTINSVIDRCENYGNISATAGVFTFAGGISGKYGLISNCINYGKISGDFIHYGHSSTSFLNCNVGGINGATSSDYIKNCINYGNISAYDNSTNHINSQSGYGVSAGGISGYCGAYEKGNIISCYNLCQSISANQEKASVGRIAGRCIKTTDCYSIDETLINGNAVTTGSSSTDGFSNNINGYSLLREELQSKENYVGFDFETVWAIDGNYNDGLPYLRVNEKIINFGICGSDNNDVKWELYDNGKLVISGDGAMAEYDNSKSFPWYEYRSEITNVVFENGITSICDYAFSNCTNIKSVELPDSITSIGSYGFYNCSNIQSITLPLQLTAISDYMFGNCTNLENITISGYIKSIGEFAFMHCENLSSVTLYSNVNKIDYSAFYLCKNLEKITIENPNCAISDYEDTISDTATIYGYSGSTAEAYATKYNRNFVALD